MHELSIMQSVVNICEQNAKGNQIKSVTLEVGELSGIIPNALEFCFESCTKGTLLENAQLIINVIPPKVRCNGCGAIFSAKAYYDSCPQCKGFDIEILFGEELRVKELEV
jgi:hydrogenase nickel incorporation protein HypA/HybF